KGNVAAMNGLGKINEWLGDYITASEWYEKAIIKGSDVWGMTNLADLYAKGRGVEKDYVLAYAWYTVAMERGNEEQKASAKKGRDGLHGIFFGISIEEEKEAEELAESYREGQLLERKR
ncbi:MAG: hypothetical protein N3G21_03800, partial [Candidatus Hydrogenedentes bacterium]|nr:hypothetical protein [Candidatus Hydrogenedentota bacterium]